MSDVETVLFGEAGVAEGLSPGKVLVDMSSISPVATEAFAARIVELDWDYLDAPVSGGDVGAKAGTLSIMVGGPAAAFERAKPIFALIGKNIAPCRRKRRRPDHQLLEEQAGGVISSTPATMPPGKWIG